MTKLMPIAVILLASASLVAYLLVSFPYDGLYGQDSYAYYGQALAWWREMGVEAQSPASLYTSQGFRWPVGYYLHIIAGFLLGGVGAWGGWALNIGMTLLLPVLVFSLVGSLLPDAPHRTRVVAGIAAAALLLLSGTYIRMGLSLMADVPALFWALAGYACALRAWPLGETVSERRRRWWAFGAGAALGIAILTRYGAIMLIPPLIVYLVLRRQGGTPDSGRGVKPVDAALATLGCCIALLPQVAYLLTHEPGVGYSTFLSDWSLGNILASDVRSADGAASYEYPMLAFFLVTPLVSSAAGFFHFFTLPAFVLGLVTLARQQLWPALGPLLTWWILPAIFFSGTPYQAHRFVLLYLPALAIIAGLGVTAAVEWLMSDRRGAITRAGAAMLLASAVVGLYFQWGGAHDWMASHARFKEEERRVRALARATVPDGETPRLVTFGQTAALHHYTGWPALDLYNHDETNLRRFIDYAGTRLVVVPESQIASQWAGTPLSERWTWLREHHTLVLLGTVGQYSVYEVLDERDR